MIKVGRDEFMLFLEGRGLEGKPTVGKTTGVMEFVDKEGHMHARATYSTKAEHAFVSVVYEILRVK